MNTPLIRTRFTRMLSAYNTNAKIQKKMAEKLINLCGKNSYNTILEIGCGTGFLTRNAVEKLVFRNYTALDIVKECKNYIQEISPKINFINSDIESFARQDNKRYDLILSNASLQWIENFEVLVTALISKLKPDGELLFSTFGKENFREIYHISGNTLKYYSIKELTQMFEAYKPFLEEEVHIMGFDSAKDVLRHLHNTGVNALENKFWTKSDLAKFEKHYNNLCRRRPTLTYNPVYVKIRQTEKPDTKN